MATGLYQCTRHLPMILIDREFIRYWASRYDEYNIGDDDEEYNLILNKVSDEISDIGAISQDTLERIADWKSFHVRHKVKWNNFGLYQIAIKYALEVPDRLKLSLLCGLEGVDIPVASTILNFMYPDKFPIIDYRVTQVLREAAEIQLTKNMSYKMYYKYKAEIEKIGEQTGYDIRTIDRALFAYHKLNPEMWSE